MSSCNIKKEEMDDQSLKNSFERLCLDLNMDMETGMDAWRSYEHIRRHYYLEGDQIHWLSVALYVSCRKNKFLSKSLNNPISISRLLKSSNHFKLLIFFDKLKKWIDMENLPDSLRKNIENIQYSFNISSIIFQKYFQLFVEIFGANENKLNEFNYSEQRKSFQINPKLNQLYKQGKLSQIHLYQLIWMIYSLTKTIYPSTSNDLIASFHLLIASFLFVVHFIQINQFHHLIKGTFLNDCENDERLMTEKLCSKLNSSNEMINVICEEYLKNGLFKDKKIFHSNEKVNEKEIIEFLNEINNQYDEIILTNCLIDERIFFEKKSQFNDLLNSFNENRNQKSEQMKTPLTANQHLSISTEQTNSILTPISQANQLISFLNYLLKDHPGKVTNQLIEFIGQQPFFDQFNQKISMWENEFYSNYCLNDDEQRIVEHNHSIFQTSKYRFQFALKLFYFTLENILIIEKKRSSTENQQQLLNSFHKLMLNNEFLKSLLSLCLLMIFYAHSDDEHDLNWIINLYKLHGYSLLKMIQIFLKSVYEMNQSRAFIKYLSSIEEILISSMVFQKDSPLWNEIDNKGILSYRSVSFINEKNNSISPFNEQQYSSPISNLVKRKLFDHSIKNEMTINRSRSDSLIEKSEITKIKMSPYRMFYKKFYQLVQSRLNLICLRLFGSQSNSIENIIWNLFIYFFEHYTKFLFQSRDLDQILLSIIFYSINSNIFPQTNSFSLSWFRLIQAYKTIPNTKLKTLRCVFIRSVDQQETFQHNQIQNENPPLTPSKPAGTIHFIHGNIFGDIASFYSEVFSKIENLEENLRKYFNENSMIELPIIKKNSFNSSIHCGDHLFINYSSNQCSFQTPNQIHINSNQIDQTNSTNNILSSSIQAGLNNRVQTTRIRTDDGKFLTTISTIPKINSNENQPKRNIQENQFVFGQSFKRTFEQDSNSLSSLTKKVLLIQNDRQTFQQ